MGRVICMFTRKKWTGRRYERRPAKLPGLRRVDQGGSWQQIGEIAAPIIGGLVRE